MHYAIFAVLYAFNYTQYNVLTYIKSFSHRSSAPMARLATAGAAVTSPPAVPTPTRSTPSPCPPWSRWPRTRRSSRRKSSG